MAIKDRKPLVASGRETHFFARGPQDVEKLARSLRDPARRGITFTHRFRWYLGEVSGVSRSEALRRIYAVLRHPKSWERSGVYFARTNDIREANIVVRIVPDGQTVCGEGAAGCYSWGWVPGPPLAEVESQYVADDIWFPSILGMELCGHGAFRMADHYAGSGHDASAYHGAMGNTFDSTHPEGHVWPSDQEIEAAKRWLRGETPPELIHDE